MAMIMTTVSATNSRFADWPLALKSILGFWLFYALTVVARAFLGSDPITALQNRLIVLGLGIILTTLIYLAIATFGAGASVRRKVIIAAVGSLIAASVLAICLLLAQNLFRESKEEFRYQAREGIVVIEKGHTIRIERTASEPLVLTMPRMHELDRNKRIRYAADTIVMWLFFFIAWSAF